MKYAKIVKRSMLVILGIVLTLYLSNASFLAPPIGSQPVLVAHRGLAQDFDPTGLTNETCTAARMLPTSHDYLENTIASMQAAFAYGADFVEFDVHPTTDGHFAVFHDWTVDCRTNGTGVTREQTLASLQSLDIGYGYTADGGKTYPFRGKGVGLMPSLDEVLTMFPTRNLIINIKSNDPQEGELLAERLALLSPEHQKKIMVYGGEHPVSVIRERLPLIQTLWIRRLKQCFVRYAAFGWLGYVPATCKQSMLMIPSNYTSWLWGWPNRFLQRMATVDTNVFLLANYQGEGFSQGLDDLKRIRDLPEDYSGGIWTDRIDLVGPAVKGSKIE
ncbi:glycerophosphoryl diester phosphodiesterase [Leptolyngbya sp. Heron Island J]|uniref:glycerophosphodiester phosphodiesterase family protein n=1 Tax=Leptolyngbya sp. Heron Island J TaxID=1385935 RepID=UPI0003B9B19A|nr:glycerophosphodiester phosphodiesterase family protein [Leptolyngbya sp. Heron Island J]ESA34576.1 glycerophosphoryl diester phosphodiesterase [Leptolyngbya sp. Heron Island J]